MSNYDEDIAFERIVSIEYGGIEQVYDIAVSGTHNFVAEGLVAHNTYIGGNAGVGTTTPWGKLSVTNTGTGPSFVVEDDTSPDSTPFIVTATGDVGIGTTSPGSLLSINNIANFTTATSSLYGTGGINITAGCFAINGTCVGGSGSGVSGGAANKVAFFTDATTLSNNTLFHFDNTNTLLGIGTSTPKWSLTIASSTGPQLALADGTNNAWTFRNAGGSFFLATSTYSATSTVAALAINSNGLATFANGLNVTGGNVGIGTTAPRGLLQVGAYGTGAYSESHVGLLANNNGEVLGLTGSNTYSNLNMYLEGTTTRKVAMQAKTGGTGSGGTLGLWTSSNSGAITERLRIDENGNVGIGTTTPGYKLTVNSTNATDNLFQVATTTNQGIFVISNAGNVGIGTTSPAAKFSIQDGNFYIAGQGVAGLDSYTKLLIHADGTDASTSFPDSSGSAHTVTVNGNAQIDTAQSKFGGASGLLDGTGDYLTVPSHADFAFGTGDFTIDFWVRWNSTVGGQDNFFNFASNGLHASIYKASGDVAVKYYNGSADAIVGTTAVTAGNWYHVALTRASGSTRLFLNGAQEGSTYADSINYGQDSLWIGAYSNGTLPVDGWMDEVRVSKGIARWTGNFTPPTSPYSSASNAGYIGIGVAAPEHPIHHSSGALLSSGGSWTNASDRNLKTNFTDVDAQGVLAGINALEIQKWNYKVENNSIMHIGPVAQDFWAQFGLGGSDKTISTIDASGVALMGVKALSERLEAVASTTMILDFSTSTTATSTVATSTASTTARDFASRFFANVFARMTMWFADSANGISEFFAANVHAENIYADTVNAKRLCLDGLCVTKDELRTLLDNAAQTAAAAGTSPAPEASTNTVGNEPPATSAPAIEIIMNGNPDGSLSEPQATAEPVPAEELTTIEPTAEQEPAVIETSTTTPQE